MGKKHLIAVLGTSGYEECIYVQGDRDWKSKFVQEATLHLACGPDPASAAQSRGSGTQVPDSACGPELAGVKVTVCLTEEARKKNWEDRSYTEEEIKRGKGKEGERYVGLKTILEGYQGLAIRELSIPTGRTEEEITEMFYTIHDAIEPEEEVYFDITHGLRNIPMLMMTVLEYAKVTKKIRIGGIYYGAFEAGIVDFQLGLKKVLLYDLTFYSEILNWSRAADIFVKHGNSDAITDLFREEWNSHPVHNKEEGKARQAKLGSLKTMVEALNTVTRCIETGRGRKEEKPDESIWKAYQRYVACRGKVTDDLIGSYKPLTVLIEKIDEKLSCFQVEDNLRIGIETIRWSMDNGMLQQGYTALEETIKTFLCQKAGVPDNDKLWREDLVKRLVSGLYGVRKEKGGDAAGQQEREYERWKQELLQNNSPLLRIEEQETIYAKGKEIFELLFAKERIRVVELAQKVGETRNSINHFGFTRNSLSTQHFEEKLREYFSEFEVIMSEW